MLQRLACGLVSMVAGLLLAAPASAQTVQCAELPGPIVYMKIGATQQPLMKELGKKLRDDNPSKPITLVYTTSGSCVNIAALYDGTKMTGNALYIPSAAEDPAWTTAMAAKTCALPAGGVDIDIANSALLVDDCELTDPGNIGHYSGPVQAYLYVVPQASTQTAISAEAAYFVFGFGAAGMVSPWVDESLYFITGPETSTRRVWAKAIDVLFAVWKGITGTPDATLASVANSATPEATIGIVGYELYNLNRGTLNALAYQAYGQRFAYYPDSTATATDNQNVRDGHYTVWSPTVYLTRTTGGVPDDLNAKYVIDLILGRSVTPAAPFSTTDIVISKGLIPACAMKVSREVEGGPLALYAPPEPCHCYYESKVGATPACAACDESTPCAAGTCRDGFCEQ